MECSEEICDGGQGWLIERWKLGPTLRSRMFSASAFPSSSLLLSDTSLPARVKTASTAARVSSRLVRVVSRAPAMANPPTLVPTRRPNEAVWVKVVTREAIAPGNRVLPGAMTERCEGPCWDLARLVSAMEGSDITHVRSRTV